jgi:hypothetical protein
MGIREKPELSDGLTEVESSTDAFEDQLTY